MRNILLIEEEQSLVESLIEEFNSDKINVFHCNDRASAEYYISDSHQFDAVILDWFFENPEDSIVSRLILKKLKNVHFRPVFIYTNNKSDFDESPKDEIDFPLNLLSCISKGEGLAELKIKINTLLENNLSLKLADTYRRSINHAFEKTLFELNEVQNVDLEKIFNKIYGNGEDVDWSADIILNLLHRALISDSRFTDNIISLLRAIPTVKSEANSLESRKIANKILYFHSKSDLIKNGDIISITNKSGKIVCYGIVITPDCDLEQKKTRYLETIELVLSASPK